MTLPIGRYYTGKAIISSVGLFHLSRPHRQFRSDEVDVICHRRVGVSRGDKMWCFVKCNNPLRNSEEYETYMWISRRYLLPVPPSYPPPPSELHYYDCVFKELIGFYKVQSCMRHPKGDSWHLWIKMVDDGNTAQNRLGTKRKRITSPM